MSYYFKITILAEICKKCVIFIEKLQKKSPALGDPSPKHPCFRRPQTPMSRAAGALGFCSKRLPAAGDSAPRPPPPDPSPPRKNFGYTTEL